MPDPKSLSIALPYLAAALLFGYLLGSIPFGLIITRLGGAGDVREIGSGNIGTTNVLRTGRKELAALTLLGDGLKGTIAYLVAARFGPDTAVVAGLGAFLGHLFPVWLKFKGGKGVATYIGVLLGAAWPIGLGFMAVWLLMALIFRYSSLSALTASFLAPIALALTDRWQLAELFVLLSLLLWYAHRENIKRLLRGEESKIGQKG
ncbi:MAG: glycerol-3-phosphate 1-O-acyltransferase PlsY [Pseudomonadota bacterium]